MDDDNIITAMNEDVVSQSQSRGITTLDEPIFDTVKRDLKRIGIKLIRVLFPRGKSEEALRDWDLWGPLVFCLLLAFPLRNVVAELFFVVWVGAGVVTFNSELLGGKISFFQSVCVLGYCVFPLLVAAYLIYLYPSWLLFRLSVSFLALVWAGSASVGFMAAMVPPQRKALAVYPVCLFYITIAWMIVKEMGRQ